jgi:hypothetical protein
VGVPAAVVAVAGGYWVHGACSGTSGGWGFDPGRNYVFRTYYNKFTTPQKHQIKTGEKFTKLKIS